MNIFLKSTMFWLLNPRCWCLAFLVFHVVSEWMDTRYINLQRFLIQSLYLQKTSEQGVRTHPPMVLLAMVREGDIKSVGLLLGIRRLPGDPLPLHMKVYIYSFRGTVPLINGEEIFYVVMMIIGISRSIITLRAAVRNHGRWCGYQRSWEVVM